MYQPSLAPRHYPNGNWAGALSVLHHELKRDMRFWQANLMGPPLQALLLAMVFLLAGAERFTGAAFDAAQGGVIGFVAPGILSVAIAARCFEAMAFAILFDKMERIIENLLGSPISALEIVIAYAGYCIVVALLTLVTVYPFLIWMGAPFPANPLGLLAAVALGGFAVGMGGMLTGLTSEKWDQMQAKDTFVLTPLVYLSGGFFALSAVPEGMRLAVQLNPLFHLTDLLRWGATGQAAGNPALSFLVIAAIGLGLAALGWHAFHSGWRLKA